MSEENKALESEIFKAKYRRIKTVGKGSFGEAILVRSKQDGKRYISKTVDTATMSPKEKRDLQNEIRILASVNHPNIIRYQEHFEDGPVMFIVMEYADGGDLNQRIKERKKRDDGEPFDPKLCMFWFLQVAMAIKYLHDKRILHRDLKTANVFLTSKNVVKLGDFGISTVLQNTMACAKTVCGTPYYFSPELCQSRPYNNKSDVWALGVVFYEILTLNRPFTAKSLKELLKKILVGQYDPIPSSVPSELRNLCYALLQISPAQRPSINRLLEQPFVQSALKNFSEELEAQTAKDRADYAEKKKQQPAQPQRPAPAQAPPAPQAPPAQPAQPAQSAKEQMAALRNMDRGKMQEMMRQGAGAMQAEMDAQKKQPQPPAGGQPRPPQSGPEDELPDVEEDSDAIQQKQVVQANAAAIAQGNVGPDEEFGDAGVEGHEEHVTLGNGESVPAKGVRKILEADMGQALLVSALDYVNDLLASPTAPSNAAIQAELNLLLGPRFAHHSNAITRLAVWEGKNL